MKTERTSSHIDYPDSLCILIELRGEYKGVIRINKRRNYVFPEVDLTRLTQYPWIG